MALVAANACVLAGDAGGSGADSSQWNLKEIGYIFSIAIAVLGLSAALFGKWLETAGPRKSMFAAACCFGVGFEIAAAGTPARTSSGSSISATVFGGIGLGLGYISPVSTLIKWFPDRPGLATGKAIMGFGGGAMIGSPLGTHLMAFLQGRRSRGHSQYMGDHGHPLLHFHDVWRLYGARACGRFEARWMDPAHPSVRHDQLT